MDCDVYASVAKQTTKGGINVPKGKGQQTVRSVLHKFKAGSLHSGSKTGPKVKSREQAIAIAISESKPKGKRK
jgi:hypothetical protein